MLRSRFIFLGYLVSFLIIGVSSYNTFKQLEVDVIREYRIPYNSRLTGVAIYDSYENNRMKCNFTTVNMIVTNMIKEDYFEIIQDKSFDDVIDIVLSNGTNQYRILYNRSTYDYMCVSNEFLMSDVPLSYIHD